MFASPDPPPDLELVARKLFSHQITSLGLHLWEVLFLYFLYNFLCCVPFVSLDYCPIMFVISYISVSFYGPPTCLFESFLHHFYLPDTLFFLFLLLYLCFFASLVLYDVSFTFFHLFFWGGVKIFSSSERWLQAYLFSVIFGSAY